MTNEYVAQRRRWQRLVRQEGDCERIVQMLTIMPMDRGWSQRDQGCVCPARDQGHVLARLSGAVWSVLFSGYASASVC